MKIKLLIGLALLSTQVMISCKKDKDESQEATTVKIGNKDYPIVKIGNQLWTTENYSGEGGVYYNNNNTKPEYGKLYTLEEAKAITIPQGWRLPTLQDYKKLFEAQGTTFKEENDGYGFSNSTDAIKKMISTTDWNNVKGTNTSGFTIYPAGYRQNANFIGAGSLALFWTSSKDALNNPFYFVINEDEADNGKMVPVAEYFIITGTNRLSIRFVKDN